MSSGWKPEYRERRTERLAALTKEEKDERKRRRNERRRDKRQMEKQKMMMISYNNSDVSGSTVANTNGYSAGGINFLVPRIETEMAASQSMLATAVTAQGLVAPWVLRQLQGLSLNSLNINIDNRQTTNTNTNNTTTNNSNGGIHTTTNDEILQAVKNLGEDVKSSSRDIRLNAAADGDKTRTLLRKSMSALAVSTTGPKSVTLGTPMTKSSVYIEGVTPAGTYLGLSDDDENDRDQSSIKTLTKTVTQVKHQNDENGPNIQDIFPVNLTKNNKYNKSTPTAGRQQLALQSDGGKLYREKVLSVMAFIYEVGGDVEVTFKRAHERMSERKGSIVFATDTLLKKTVPSSPARCDQIIHCYGIEAIQFGVIMKTGQQANLSTLSVVSLSINCPGIKDEQDLDTFQNVLLDLLQDGKEYGIGYIVPTISTCVYVEDVASGLVTGCFEDHPLDESQYNLRNSLIQVCAEKDMGEPHKVSLIALEGKFNYDDDDDGAEGNNDNDDDAGQNYDDDHDDEVFQEYVKRSDPKMSTGFLAPFLGLNRSFGIDISTGKKEIQLVVLSRRDDAASECYKQIVEGAVSGLGHNLRKICLSGSVSDGQSLMPLSGDQLQSIITGILSRAGDVMLKFHKFVIYLDHQLAISNSSLRFVFEQCSFEHNWKDLTTTLSRSFSFAFQETCPPLRILTAASNKFSCLSLERIRIDKSESDFVELVKKFETEGRSVHWTSSSGTDTELKGLIISGVTFRDIDLTEEVYKILSVSGAEVCAKQFGERAQRNKRSATKAVREGVSNESTTLTTYEPIQWTVQPYYIGKDWICDSCGNPNRESSYACVYEACNRRKPDKSTSEEMIMKPPSEYSPQAQATIQLNASLGSQKAPAGPNEREPFTFGAPPVATSTKATMKPTSIQPPKADGVDLMNFLIVQTSTSSFSITNKNQKTIKVEMDHHNGEPIMYRIKSDGGRCLYCYQKGTGSMETCRMHKSLAEEFASALHSIKQKVQDHIRQKVGNGSLEGFVYAGLKEDNN